MITESSKVKYGHEPKKKEGRVNMQEAAQHYHSQGKSLGININNKTNSRALTVRLKKHRLDKLTKFVVEAALDTKDLIKKSKDMIARSRPALLCLVSEL